MKKYGFTLVEVILVLGIIGVVAALAVPALGNLMPDQNKVKVLKAYKVINDLTKELLNDPGIYECPKLSCGEPATREEYDQARGIHKFSYYFLQKIDIANHYTEGMSHSGVGTQKFSTKDSMYWQVGASGDGQAIEILVNVDGKKAEDGGKSCAYSSSCTKPNQFKFTISDNGTVYGNDALTRAYIANPYKLNDRKNDLLTAKNDKTNIKDMLKNDFNPIQSWLDHEKHLGDGVVRFEDTTKKYDSWLEREKNLGTAVRVE